MGKCKAVGWSSLFCVIVLLLTGCGQETATIPDIARPVVSSTDPANSAVGVSLARSITATFSKPMNPATITAATFKLAGPGGVSIPGNVTYSATGSMATFSPASSLAYGTTYIATITNGATDQASPANPLAANYVWSFTTLSAPGMPTPPAVIATTPLNGTMNVPLSQSVTASFNMAMSPATLNATTFRLTTSNGVMIPGAVSYTSTGNLLTFIPAAPLTSATTYIVTITTGAQNADGISLAANYTWSFATVPPLIVAPIVVSTNPVNSATSVPQNQVTSATFSMAMNASTINSNTFKLTGPGGAAVPGTVNYSGGTANFVPSAALATSTTYVATVTTGAQSASGTPLANDYVWTFTTVPTAAPPSVITTNPLANAANVPFNQQIAATFSLPMDPATLNAATFTVTAPGGTPVAGAVTYVSAGSIVTFSPTVALLPLTTYVATITSGTQSSTGLTLASNYAWAFTTGAAPDITPPTVVSTLPLNGATDVPFNQAITANFSEAMDPSTLNSATFIVTAPGDIPVSGLVTYAAISNSVTFTPTAQLPANTLLKATVTSDAKDLAGNTLLVNYVWTFNTSSTPDTVAPTMTVTVPSDGAMDVPFNQVISATFSEAMNPLSLTSSSFQLVSSGGSPVAATISYDAVNFVASLHPVVALASGTSYSVVVTAGATDLAGNPLGEGSLANPWTFTTSLLTVSPTVVSTNPVNGSNSVPQNQIPSATFSVAMNASTINSTTFKLAGPGGVAVVGTVNYSGGAATFVPSAALATNTTYVATMTTGAQSSVGIPLANDYVWTFTTVPAAAPPSVVATNPVANAASVPFNQQITAVFNQAMNPATLNATTFTVNSSLGTAVAGTVAYVAGSNATTFTPSTGLLPNTTYVATITTGAKDTTGTGLAANYVWTFRTVPGPTPPTVISTTPANNAASVALNQKILATFSEAMNSSTINETSFTLTAPGGVAVAGTVTYLAAGSIATLSPNTDLAPNTTYVATITTGAQNSSGTPLATNYLWTFTTVAAPGSPVVTVTTPANGAGGVAINAALNATFNMAMNASTINSSTFKLAGPGGAAVAGAVTYAGTVGTFVPSTALATNTTYVATITTGAQTSSGIPLATDYLWTFTTAAAPGSPVVTVINPANEANGVAVEATLNATFSMAMNASTINSSTFKVAGPGGAAIAGVVTYSAGTATLVPFTSLATNTTYVATITTGAQSSLGIALASDYVWTFTTVPPPTPPSVVSSIPLNGATGVPLNQTLGAVFDQAMNPATLNGTTFTVNSSLGTVVSGTVAYIAGENTATFTPSSALLPNTTYVATIKTGAQNTTGTGLAGNYVWAFRTVPAPTPPTVISTTPANSAASVPINQKILATFSEAMDSGTINESTFTLTAPGAVAVAGTVTYLAAGSIATFSPNTDLTPNTTYVATITTDAKDLLGIAISNNYVWTFTTLSAGDTTKPSVISTVPLNSSTGVAFNTAITATFSEAMDPTTITSSTFTVTGPGIIPVVGAVTYAAIGNTATFTPTASLAPATLFTATITTEAADLAGNTIATSYVWTFTTGAIPDTTSPTITLTTPVSGDTAVPLTQTISATFSEAMDPLTLTTATFTLATAGGNAVTGTVAYDSVNFIATFTPSGPLVAGTSYLATVTTGAKDLAGVALAAGSIPNPWNFATSSIVVPPPVSLGTAALFGGFGGGAGITNQGTLTVINGNIGTTGSSTLITGFHDNTPNCTYTETPLNIGLVNGTVSTAPPSPTVGCPDEGTAATAAISEQASADALSAYNALVAFPNGLDVSTCSGCGGGAPGELGNRVLAPGIYKSAIGSFAVSEGDLTLDAQGDPNAFWVFQMATTMGVGTPSAPRNILLTNGAQARNVFWQVGTAATLNGILGGGTVQGTIISQAATSVSTAGIVAITTINGRLLVLSGPLTLVNTVINVPAP